MQLSIYSPGEAHGVVAAEDGPMTHPIKVSGLTYCDRCDVPEAPATRERRLLDLLQRHQCRELRRMKAYFPGASKSFLAVPIGPTTIPNTIEKLELHGHLYTDNLLLPEVDLCHCHELKYLRVSRACLSTPIALPPWESNHLKTVILKEVFAGEYHDRSHPIAREALASLRVGKVLEVRCCPITFINELAAAIADGRRAREDPTTGSELRDDDERQPPALLFPLHHLRVLNLASNGMDEDEARVLAQALQTGRCPQLETLILAGNSVGGDGVRIIGTALATPLRAADGSDGSDEEGAKRPQRVGAHIKHIDFDWCGIGDAGATALAETLLQAGACPQVENLELRSWGREIGVDGITSLAEGLRAGGATALKRLILLGNGVGDAGATALAETLLRTGACPQLEVLNLAYNDIGDEGVSAIANSLRSTTTNTIPTITPDNAGAVAPVCAQLRELDLTNNAMTDVGARDLTALLQEQDETDISGTRSRYCPRLTELDVSNIFDKDFDDEDDYEDSDDGDDDYDDDDDNDDDNDDDDTYAIRYETKEALEEALSARRRKMSKMK